MLDYLKEALDDYFDDFAFNGSQSAKKFTGKTLIKGGAHAIAAPVGEAAASVGLGRAVQPLVGGTAKLLGITALEGKVAQKAAGTFILAAPLVSAFGMWMEQEEYNHNRIKLLNEFRPEIAAWLSGWENREVRPEKLTQEDLDRAAFGDRQHGIPPNMTLQHALLNMGRERNWNMGISVAASVGSTLIGSAAESSVEGFVEKTLENLGASTVLHDGGMTAAVTLGSMLTVGVIAYAVYVAIKTPLHFLAEKVFGVEKHTATDEIRDIRQLRDDGRGVKSHDVLEVYLAAHHDLAQDIKARYGKPFKHLSSEMQDIVIGELDPQLGLKRLADDICEGRLRPEELAFSVQGQASGVLAEPIARTEMPEPENAFTRAWNTAKEAMQAAFRQPKAPQAQPDYSRTTLIAPDGLSQATLETYDFAEPQGRRTSFVNLVGKRATKNGDISWREFAEQTRTDAGIELT